MPAEHPALVDAEHQQPQPIQQVKLCSSCSNPLSPDSAAVLLSPDAAIVCTPCRDRIVALRVRPPPVQLESVVPEQPFIRPRPSPRPPIAPYHAPSTPPLQVQTPPQREKAAPVAASPASQKTYTEPYTDITRLRTRSQSRDCLYPGAKFVGTQKSGRSSYDVSVTIVDVDFSSSFLCGYLRIRGLTDDWPELTTYFDAEIIGPHHTFLTREWGASAADDLTHWSRFPAFRRIRHEVAGPRMAWGADGSGGGADRDVVFMRWKERFLVPDHRVRDINGASFAGFYYVCVEFNGPSPDDDMDMEVDGDTASSPSCSGTATSPHPPKAGCTPAPREEPSLCAAGNGRATMSGFYFHQNSEPYQQLSLHHVPERTIGCFEFR